MASNAEDCRPYQGVFTGCRAAGGQPLFQAKDATSSIFYVDRTGNRPKKVFVSSSAAKEAGVGKQQPAAVVTKSVKFADPAVSHPSAAAPPPPPVKKSPSGIPSCAPHVGSFTGINTVSGPVFVGPFGGIFTIKRNGERNYLNALALRQLKLTPEKADRMAAEYAKAHKSK